MKSRTLLSVLALLGLLLGSLRVGPIPARPSLAAPAAVIRYVQPVGQSSGACDSWANACELQYALGVAVAGDEIWVKAGTYKPTTGSDRTATFQLVGGVAIYGGFAGTETSRDDRDWQTHVTTLSGDLLGNDGPNFANYGDNSYHVVTGSGVAGTAVLDGFTISGGNADGDTYNGGGMVNVGGSPALSNLTFSGNKAGGHGGGMYNYNHSSPALTDCQFTDNVADSDSYGGGNGGGMYNELDSSPVLSGTHFLANLAWDGGGMHNGNGSNPKLTNVTFSSNTAGGGDGGGMHNYPGSSPELTNVTFISNTATVDGGGISNGGSSNPTLTNVTFSGNTATGNGGGIYNWQSNPTLRNCVLWGNTATTGGNQIFNSSSTPAIAWSDIQGSGGSLVWDASLGTDGGGNLDADPLFVDATAGDLHLGLDSPAVDRGNNDYVTVTTDLDGYPRIGNGRVDMGAYEFQYPVPPGTIHVDAGATGARDGSDWPDALTSLRFALAWAAVGVTEYGLPGVEIWVAEGTYKPDPGADREATFQLHSGVALNGGFPSGGGARDWETHVTTLSGDLLGNDGPDFANYDENSYHVVTGSGVTGTAVLDGLTISGGNAEGSSYMGGGMLNVGGSPTLRNLTFSRNTAIHGGGMRNEDSSPVLTGTYFYTNTAILGGGMQNEGNSNPTLTNCTFSGNTATRGGGMCNYDHSSPALSNVTFSGNAAYEHGGGMYDENSSPTLTDCQFTDNVAGSDNAYSGDGGGMYNDGSNPTLSNVTFSGNMADHGGGMRNWGFSNPTLSNVTFSGNTGQSGGGMYNSEASSPALTNCQFTGNVANSDIYGGGEGGGMYNELDSNPTLSDCIFSGNTTSCEAGGCIAEGGGIYNSESNPTLSNVTFSGNTADYGGGMHNRVGSSPTLTSVTFSGNSATQDGGGMYNYDHSGPTLANCTFSGNSARAGGGMHNEINSSPVLSGTHFLANFAWWGGGMHNGHGSNPKLTNVTFSDNTAGGGDGGGMHNDPGSSPELTNVTFINNTATVNGGGMANRGSSNPTLTNCTFSGNAASGHGGGIDNWQSSPTLKRITFTHNTATTSGGGMYNEASGPVLVNASFVSNTATFGGGGMYNKDCTLAGGFPRLVNTLFNNNAATGTTGNEGNGGGMYNEGSSPELVNVTFGNNTATQYGGGIADFSPGSNVSTPHLDNCVLWANTSGSGTPEQDQIYDAPDGSGAIYGFSCTIESSQPQASPFVDADGADGIPGTADDDLRLAHTSEAIDGGDETLELLTDLLDLDGDGNTTEELPFDLDGNVRRYADENLDGIPDPVGAPYSDRKVDQGAYEAGCYAWHMHYGADWLAEGQKYRLGFHHEIDDPSTVTISDTLASYAAERAAGNLAEAKTAYGLALDCAVTVTQTNQALAGLLKVTWEQATGALLEGNEEMVTALDLTDAGGMAIEITALETAIDKYTEATVGYLLPLGGEHQADFLAAMGISRTHPITYTEVITQVDVQRLAASLAKKSQATLELAERRFRSGDGDVAEGILRQGTAQATVELALLKEIWPGVVDDVNYHALERNMSDMNRLWNYLTKDKNPLGYSPEWIPIHYRPGIDLNNYLRVDELAGEKLGIGDHWGAQDAIDLAATESEKVHDEYAVMQQRYWDIEAEYDRELMQMCWADDGEPDLDRCDGGDIQVQISAVDQAQLRLGRVLEQMNVLNKRIQIEVEAWAEEHSIYEATAELISTDGDMYSSMVEQEEQISTGWRVVKGVAGILQGITGGGKAGGVFGKKGAIAGGLFGALGPAMDMVAGLFGPEEGPPKEEKLLEFQAWQNAQMVICDGQIADVEFEKRIKELFLEYGLLDIDYSIALENLHQELLRLDGMRTRVEYLLAEKARAMAFTTLLYRDPGHRVLRDYYMEMAQDSYDTALDYTFRAGRALEYEANLTSTELDSPDPDEVFGIRNIATLITARADTKTAYDDWSADKTPQPRTTVVRLSRALNYEDTEIDGQPVTAEEQFNAYVVRNPDNRSDEDGDGVAESLRFTFDTSIFKGNPFFDYCLFNDRIESVQVRLRGADLGLDSVTVRLGWGDVGCADTDCGTTFIRSEGAFSEEDPDGSGYLDDLRAYKIQPKSATIQAATGDAAFPEPANTDLALRSVACPYWVFKFPGALPANEGFNLDNVDEIELIIKHSAYSLQAPMCLASGTLTPAPSRPYRPMEQVLDPMSSPLLAALADDRNLNAGDAATSLNGLYAGTVAITSPQYMPALDLNLVLTQTGGTLTGYIDAAQSLHVPVVDEATGHGPGVSGSWSGEGFSLQSEVFATTLGLGLPVTRQVILHSGVISNSGEYLTGAYSETLAGLTPEPMVIYGDFELWRPPAAIGPSASFSAFPVIGPVPLTVAFSDFSTGDPTGWTWDFGDGGTSTEQHPTHTYTAMGTYTVTLTVGNTLGSDTAVMPSYITVLEPQAPEADFSADPTSGMVPLTVTFSDQSSNYPTAWLWRFGDGGTSMERNPVHVYNTAASFTVSLTVSNTVGSDTVTMPDFITVTEGNRIYLPLVLRRAP